MEWKSCKTGETDMKMNLAQELVVKKLLGKIKDTDIEKILKEYNVI